ncbi:PREDICTED: transient receptor potential cation channel protein painless [Ceratosolen solmsi marchali]|uniref:Transient receptor potential cation channel protein painless n=1 Tax=Ceratosolen solmsi marchali TaxID=326594 RepID=A0AAJ7DXE3_9HYME|nr:PREDICTED: transient receptor potential cation channel protein painless [Ceratosolen solmsi marchali]
MIMDSDDTESKMHLIQNQVPKEYALLLSLLERRHLAAFKSLVRRNLYENPASIDLNYRLPYPILMNFLDKAASDNLPEFVDFLLEMGADPNIVNSERNRAPIHFATEAGNVAALGALLQHRNISLNIKAGGLTALHFAVKANSEECARLLLEAGASPNVTNSQGLTALHFAAEKNKRNMVQLIVDKSQILELDTYRDRKKETTRMIIQRKYPDIALPETLDRLDYERLLRYYLTANDEVNFLKALEKMEDIVVNNKIELLKIAIEHNLRDAAKELLHNNIPDTENLYELGKIAIEQAYPDILHELLTINAKLANRLLLPASQELGISTRPGTANTNNRLKCLKMILNQDGVDVRQEDDKGNSPLHYAARAECQEALELLLQKGSYIGHMNNFNIPPLVHITSDALKNHLDDCLTSCNEGTEEYEIIMNYKNLAPQSFREVGDNENEEYTRPFGSSNGYTKSRSETETLLYIASQKNLRHLLKHPLLASFLYLKYLNIRHILYLNFFLYVIFFINLNLYIWLISSAPVQTEVSSTNINATVLNGHESSDILRNWKNQLVVSILLFVSLMYMLIRELLQFASSPLNYISSLMNWFEIVLIALTFALLCGASSEVGAVAILLSTWELIILMAQHPRMSIDIEMFKTVTINFTKFLFLYIFLILAFAFSFFVLFKENESFPNPFASLFKTIVMITGEFDASNLPFVIYPILSRFIFIGFIFLIVIILLNLLNGLAVNDTAEILAESELVCLISRAQLVAYVERVVVGSSFLPRTQSCCCINYLLLRRVVKSPLHFLARKILLFPSYLPYARLSIKPLKSFEMTLHGQEKRRNRCSALKMDPLIAQRAKDILTERNKQSSEDKILAQLNALRKTFEGLEANVRKIQHTLTGNTVDDSEKS